jgi:RNA polymerase sigma-70 factor (ECF subfamily)
MLGSATDAEDMVQEAYLRWQGASEEEVRSPKAYLSAVVTRLCIDLLKSARVQKEMYVGPWLPEPILTEQAPDMTRSIELTESVSVAFLLMMERLTPVERAVFLLHDVFDYSYAEIAQIVGKSEANCRQMGHRAQQHIREHRPRFKVSREQQEKTTRSFIRACTEGDLNDLMSLLTADVVLKSDGGGKVLAARNPIHGADNVARFVFGILRKLPPGSDIGAEIAEVNGQSAVVAYLDGALNAVWTFEFDGDRASSVNVIVNPDKLQTIATQLGR